MLLENNSRLTQFVSVGAVALSLIGCEPDPKLEATDPVGSHVPKMVAVTRTRKEMLKVCLEDKNMEKFHSLFEFGYNYMDNLKFPWQTHAIVIGSITINLNTCKIGVKPDGFECWETPADGVWDIRQTVGKDLDPKTTPAMWKEAGEACNGAYSMR